LSSEEIEGRELEHIREVAGRFGLEVAGARRQGVMLELTPKDLGALPAASELAEIADALAGDGIRYVSLSLDGALGEEG
jgi:hypothetical protein